MTQNIYKSHDHHACVHSALERAQALCSAQGARLTPIRQRVLELVWANHKPVGAYDLLPKLAAEGFNSAPPTVYRALDFLLELGLVHRISSLNAFIGCTHPGEVHPSCFFVCRECGKAQELDPAQVQQIARQAEAALGVTVEQQMTELTGLCPACKAAA
ncbi:transcriptional repressor [Venatoribacter cucullus]|uniref:Ferric uptake regulation protein n=1 Tax=Venatoribacter cucullus TaxID=2661630 RepID=A0A9X7YNF0_9GAMM|nr:Fur family transcriptional regulator [Venatoribacter cucullus]QQD23022.1 transcriptional repressor [Venatoribacter cucullus]